MRKVIFFFVTLGFIGYLPYGSGTAASLITVILAYNINVNYGSIITLITAFIITSIGFFITKIYLEKTNKKDPPEVVIDEVSGQMLASSFAGLSWETHLISFIIFRVLDIYKPFPINKVESFKGSLGVMGDDILAGFITMCILFFLNPYLTNF